MVREKLKKKKKKKKYLYGNVWNCKKKRGDWQENKED